MVRPGDMVAERYQVVEQLASGGMGTVWRARHIELDVDVALKFITTAADGSHDPARLTRFKREAKAAARLNSPNIVRVLDYGIFEGQPFLAMELLRGEDLAQHLAREGTLSPERCAQIIDGIAKAMLCAHDAGIVHRDLKPANIFLEQVGSDELVKVLDYGVAKDLSAVGQTAEGPTGDGLVGSPAYMSPEQAWAEKVDARTDVWAMGVVAFEMLTGNNPFADDSLAKVFEKILRNPLPKPSQHRPELPAALDAFFEHALARPVVQRVPSAQEFAARFRRALREEGPPANPVAGARAATSVSPFAGTEHPRLNDAGPRPRRRAVLWMTLASVAVTVLALLMLTRERDRPGAQPPSWRRGREQPVTKPRPRAAPPVDAIQNPPSTRTAITDLPAAIPPTTPSDAPAKKQPQKAAAKAVTKSTEPSDPPPVSAPARTVDPRFGIPLNR